jgi:hypothetical protein
MGSPEFLSKRVKKTSQTGLSSTRYDYLSLEQAEPDLGDPIIGPSSVGAKQYPPGQDAFLLAAFPNPLGEPNRFWVPPNSLTGLGLGLLPGAFTIRDEGNLVGAANSFNTVNFVGVGVSIDPVSVAGTQQTGIATVRFTYPGFGNVNEFQYHTSSGVLGGSTGIVFNPVNTFVGFGTTNPGSKVDVAGNLTVRNNLFVTTSAYISGIAVTTLTVSGQSTFSSDVNFDSGTLFVNSSTNRVGIGSTIPQRDLDISGDIRVGGFVYVSNGPGSQGQVIVSQGTNPPIWANQSEVVVGAAQSITVSDEQNSNNTFYIGFSSEKQNLAYFRVDSTGLIYNPSANRLGIGTTQALFNLDVNGDMNFNGSLYQGGQPFIASRWTVNNDNSIYRLGSVGIGTTNVTDRLTVSGNSTITGIITASNFSGNLNAPSGIATVGFLTASNAFIGNLISTGIATLSSLTVSNVNNVGIITSQLVNIGTGGTVFFSSTTSGSVGIGSTIPRSKFDLSGDSRLNGTTNLEGSVTERVVGTFGTDFPSTSGVLSVDASTGTVAVGVLTESVTKWSFTGVSTERGKVTTITLIIDSSSLLSYGENCDVNGSSVSGGVRWNGGIAPITTDNEDILSFAIARDINGVVRVYGSSSLNFS